MTACIPANQDIVGIGARTAVYAQNMLGFYPAFFALRDKNVTPTELEALEAQSTTILITAFALLLSTAIQSTHLPGYYVSVILQLSWINNTNTFIYFILYFYRRANWLRETSELQVTSDQESSGASKASHLKTQTLKDEILKAATNPVFLIGGLHLSIMAGIGVWFWGNFFPFDDRSVSCSSSASSVFLVWKEPLTSSQLRTLSLVAYSVFLPPVANLFLPMAVFIAPFLIYHGVSDITAIGRDVAPAFCCLGILFLFDLVQIVDIELGLHLNAKLIQSGNGSWTFGQILALLLLLVPFRDLVEILFERRPKRLGKKFLDAAKAGEWDVMVYVLEQGANINFKDSDGRTALFFASEGAKLDIVRQLIGRGAGVGLEAGQRALSFAAQHGDNQLVSSLALQGVDVNAPLYPESPLHEAAAGRHPETVKLLLSLGARTNDVRSLRTALSIAITTGETGIIRMLVEAGADVNGYLDFDHRGIASKCSPISLAIRCGAVEVASLLLKLGADAVSEAYDAIHDEDLDVLRFLLDHGLDANANALDGAAEPLLFFALCVRGSFPTALCLIEDGDADLDMMFHIHHTNAGPVTYRSTLMEAARTGKFDVVRFLLQHGTRVDGVRDEAERTALFHAVDGRCLRSVRAMLDHGASTNVQDCRGRTALFNAIQAGGLPIVEILLHGGVNADVPDNEGDTPLIHAIKFLGRTNETADRRSTLRIVDCLVEHGVNIDAMDNGGNRPLSLVVEQDDAGLVEYLLRRGAIVQAADISLAKRYRFEDILSLLNIKGIIDPRQSVT